MSGVTANIETEPQNQAPVFPSYGRAIWVVGGDGRYDVGDTVQLAGRAFDPGGRSVDYQWIQIGGPMVAFSNPNSYLQASDGKTTTDSNTVSFNVESINAPPVPYGATAWGNSGDGKYTLGEIIGASLCQVVLHGGFAGWPQLLLFLSPT